MRNRIVVPGIAVCCFELAHATWLLLSFHIRRKHTLRLLKKRTKGSKPFEPVEKPVEKAEPQTPGRHRHYPPTTSQAPGAEVAAQEAQPRCRGVLSRGAPRFGGPNGPLESEAMK